MSKDKGLSDRLLNMKFMRTSKKDDIALEQCSEGNWYKKFKFFRKLSFNLGDVIDNKVLQADNIFRKPPQIVKKMYRNSKRVEAPKPKLQSEKKGDQELIEEYKNKRFKSKKKK